MATNNRQSKAERQVNAREQARRMQEEQRRREKRNAAFTRWGIVGAVVLVIALVAGIIFMNSARSIPDSGPAPAVANENGGVELTSATEISEQNIGEVDAAAVPEVEITEPATTVPGAEARPEGEPAQVIVYADANCVHCAEFEKTNGAQLRTWLEAGDITLEYRLVAYLDNSGTQNYSSRAANTALCVADQSPESYLTFLEHMFGAYSGRGVSDDELKTMARDAGADVDSCVDGNTYRPFVKYADKKAREAQVAGTPNVFVQGQQWDGNADPDFVAFAQNLIDNRG